MRPGEITRIRTVARAKHQVRDGFRYAWHDPLLREVLIVVTVVGTFAYNFTVMLPLFTHTSLHGPKTDFAYLTCSLGLGGLLGALFVAHRSRPTIALFVGLGLDLRRPHDRRRPRADRAPRLRAARPDGGGVARVRVDRQRPAAAQQP